MEIIFFLSAIRLLVPLLILKLPILGIALSVFVDLYDWQFYPVGNEKELAQYQTWDKILDFYYHLFILFIVLKFKDIIARRTAVFLFFYRTLGLALFAVTQNRHFLFFFPNFFENFVIFYLVYRLFSKEEIMFRAKKTIVAIISVILVPKVIHEYFQHFLLRQPWEIYDIGAYLKTGGLVKEYINYLSWGFLLYLIPMGLLLYFLVNQKVIKNLNFRYKKVWN